MRCNHCRSEMQQTDTVTEGRARQTWYRCPVCASSQTISQPQQPTLQRIGNLLRCTADGPETATLYRGLY